MIKNESNFAENIKFRDKTKSRIIYFTLFMTWIVSYIMINGIEKSSMDGYMMFALTMSFAVISLVQAFIVPSQREEGLKLFKFGLLGICSYSIMFDIVLWAALQGTGESSLGILMNICRYGRIMLCVTLMLWQAKNIFFFFKGRRTKDEEYENLKTHGNDGL